MRLDGARILVVDDEEFLRETVVELFGNSGAETVGAENGKIALEILKGRQFDIVLSDVRMPGGDGVELTKNIISQIRPIPKIFLCTGYSDLSEEEAKKLGATAMFAKPFQVKMIIQAMANTLK